MADDIGFDNIAGYFKAVPLLRLHGLQGIEATRARKACSLGDGACHGAGCLSKQKSAINFASTLSVLVRTRRDVPNALI